MSLFQKVCDLLHDKKPDLARKFSSTYSDRGSDEQRSLNHHFRIVLSKAPVSTLDERECLSDDIDPDVWLRYFESHVIPTLVRFNLA